MLFKALRIEKRLRIVDSAIISLLINNIWYQRTSVVGQNILPPPHQDYTRG